MQVFVLMFLNNLRLCSSCELCYNLKEINEKEADISERRKHSFGGRKIKKSKIKTKKYYSHKQKRKCKTKRTKRTKRTKIIK